MSDGNNSTSSLDSLCEDAEVETAGGTNHKKKRPLSRPVSSKPVNLVQCSSNHNNQIPLSPSPDFQSRPQSSQDEKLEPPPLFKSDSPVPSSAQEIQVEVTQQSQFEFCRHYWVLILTYRGSTFKLEIIL